MWKLVIEDDQGHRTKLSLTRDEYGIGRGEKNHLRLTEKNVSRQHARLVRFGQSYAVEDLASYNGTYLNGERIAARRELAFGDLLQIGEYCLLFEEQDVTAPPPLADTDPGPSRTKPGEVLASSPLLGRPARLVMLHGPTPGKEFPLLCDRTIVGRDDDQADLVVVHPSVSRRHCEISPLAFGTFDITDLGSSNGVRVNGKSLERGLLDAGDILELGELRFRFVREGEVYRPAAKDLQTTYGSGPLYWKFTPHVVFVAVVAIGVAVAWMLSRP
jgi:pSer/pThr/pTyr-binding forkhead associated (FHA) protein